jgi:nucleoside-diphosphate-sugar epimerase
MTNNYSEMRKFSNILVTGGAGYIGSVLTRKLVLSKYNVKVLDSLIFGQDGISDLVSDNLVNLFVDDIRNKKIIADVLKDVDCVIHLAAIVGGPLCSKIPKAAKQINEFATKHIIDSCKKAGVQRFIFASTCSNYGSALETVNEDTPLESLSLYSETKVKSEFNILNHQEENFEPCVLRFATAYGLSPRMRFDLLLQEFIRDALVDKKISIFGPNHWRPLVHVDDIASACITAIENSENISGEVYNVGDNEQNYTKKDLAEMIRKHIPSSTIEITESKQDPRNYKVSFDKIRNKLNFHVSKTAEDGISEILNKIKDGELDPRDSEFSNLSKAIERVKVF